MISKSNFEKNYYLATQHRPIGDTNKLLLKILHQTLHCFNVRIRSLVGLSNEYLTNTKY